MLRPRIIPCLLIKNGGLVKTVQFANPKYVGDPINAVRIFNDKEVDELIVIDIDATVQSREPDYLLIKNLASECRMPFCYGGGVKNVGQVEKIISLGVEKVAIGSAFITNEGLVKEAAKVIGSQSIVVVLDVKKSRRGDSYEVWTHNGTRSIGQNPTELAKRAENLGAGEIVINSIDDDGMMKGYDFSIIDQIRQSVSVPISVLGGAGSLNDIGRLIRRYGIIGAAAGSLYVFKGAYRAVLINYPNRIEKEKLIKENFST